MSMSTEISITKAKRSAAAKFLEQGFDIVSLGERYRRFHDKPDISHIPFMFNDCTLDLAMYLDGMVIVDCDNEAAVEWAEKTLPLTDWRVITPHGMHFGYRLDDKSGVRDMMRIPGQKAEILCGPKRIVKVPPSNGYMWNNSALAMPNWSNIPIFDENMLETCGHFGRNTESGSDVALATDELNQALLAAENALININTGGTTFSVPLGVGYPDTVLTFCKENGRWGFYLVNDKTTPILSGSRAKRICAANVLHRIPRALQEAESIVLTHMKEATQRANDFVAELKRSAKLPDG